MSEPWKQFLLQLSTMAVGPDIPGDKHPPASIQAGCSTAVAPSPEAVKDLCPLTRCRKKAINSGQGKLSGSDPKRRRGH